MKPRLIVPAIALGLSVFISGCATYGPPGPPPPAPPFVIAPAGPPPYSGAIWITGNWLWNPEDNQYEWRPGYWAPRCDYPG